MRSTSAALSGSSSASSAVSVGVYSPFELRWFRVREVLNPIAPASTAWRANRAIASTSSGVAISRCAAIGNGSGQIGNGGGISGNGGGGATLFETTIVGCTAAVSGGGISWANAGDLTLGVSTVTGCTAVVGGGIERLGHRQWASVTAACRISSRKASERASRSSAWRVNSRRAASVSRSAARPYSSRRRSKARLVP